ncbi:29520_t:CDS:2, partial [Gigaspora margarita]
MLTVQMRMALYFDCASGYYDCVKLLIKHAANINTEADIVKIDLYIWNIKSANVNIEEIVKDNEHILEKQETFVQVLQ